MEAFIGINTLINSSHHIVRVLLTKIMESAQQSIGADASSLLLGSDKGLLSVEIALGDVGGDVKKYTMETGENIAGWVMEHNQSLIINDAKNDSIQNLIIVPLRIKDDVIGVIEVINKSHGRYFDDENIHFLENLSDLASIILQHSGNFSGLNTKPVPSKPQISPKPADGNPLIWKSPATGKLLNEMKKMAKVDKSILIIGESGVGKELVAEYIHQHSHRASGPFIRVNCAAIPNDLIEAELFGHVKGAYTDAIQNKSGYFERADGGSLFLDEIAELSVSAQAKLLRVLQDNHMQRVGGENSVKVNVRIIAATNKNMLEAIQNSILREDLYYRLAVLTLEIPPLRDRPEDIEALARHFLMSHHAKNPDLPTDFSIDSLGAMLTYRWPGNVRELQNVIERAVISGLGKKMITPKDLTMGEKDGVESHYPKKILRETVRLFKKNFIRSVLKEYGGHQTLAAKALGIQRTYLSRVMKELSIKYD